MFRTGSRQFLSIVAIFSLAMTLAIARTSSATNHWKPVEDAMGRAGQVSNTEVNFVMETLRQNGIAVTAVHNHMLMEEPRLFFMHFCANDDAVKLAKGPGAALEQANSAK